MLPDPYLAPKPLFGLSFHAPKIPLYHTISNIIPAMPLRNLPKIFFLPSFLKLFLIRAQRQNVYFFLFIVCLFVCAVDHGVTEAEPRAGVRGPAPRARTRRTVLRSGLPGRLCEWQVQSHPLIAYFDPVL